VNTSSLSSSESSEGSQIFFVLHGNLGSSSTFFLGESYVLGETQIFEKTLDNIGTPECLEVSTNSNDNWLFDSISVSHKSETLIFNNGAIGLDADGDLEFVTFESFTLCSWASFFLLYPFGLFVPLTLFFFFLVFSIASYTIYVLTVTTSFAEDAGTEQANLIGFYLVGEAGVTSVFNLTEKQTFLSGSTFTTLTPAEDIGEVLCIGFLSTASDNWIFENATLSSTSSNSITFYNGQFPLVPNRNLEFCGFSSSSFSLFFFFFFFFFFLNPFVFCNHFPVFSFRFARWSRIQNLWVCERHHWFLSN